MNKVEFQQHAPASLATLEVHFLARELGIQASNGQSESLADLVVDHASQVASLSTKPLRLKGKNAPRLSREFASRSKPTTVRELVGHTCHEIRAVLGLQKKELAKFSHIGEESFRAIESGTARINIYRNLLSSIPRYVKSVLPRDQERQQLVETRRRRAAKLLAIDSGLQNPINKLVWEISLLLGETNFRRYGNLQLASIRQRDHNGSSGPAYSNWQLVSKFATADLKAKNGTSPTKEQLLQHYAIQRLVHLSVREQKDLGFSQGLERTASNACFVAIKALVQLHGPANREALISRYGISSSEARAYAQNNVVTVLETSKTILEKLVVDGIVTDQQRLKLSEAISTALTKPLSKVPAVVKKLWNGLERFSLHPMFIADITGITDRDPGSYVRQQISKLALENGRFSFHTIAALAANSEQEVLELTEDIFDTLSLRSRQRGRRYSSEAESLLIHGQSLGDFSETFQSAKYPRYEEDRETPPDDAFLSQNQARGEAATAKLLNAWIDVHCPRSPSAVVSAIKVKTENLQPIVSDVQTSHMKLNKIEASKDIPSLQFLERLLTTGGLVGTDELYLRWNLQVADSVHDRSPFARALYVLRARNNATYTDWFMSLGFAELDNPPISFHEFSRLARLLIRDDEPKHHAFTLKRVRYFLDVLKQGGVSDPILRYLESCFEFPDLSQRFFEAVLASQGDKGDRVVSDLEKISKRVSSNPRTPRHRYSGALKKKVSLQQALDKQSGTYRQRSKVWPRTRQHTLIDMLPGITTEELHQLAKALKRA